MQGYWISMHSTDISAYMQDQFKIVYRIAHLHSPIEVTKQNLEVDILYVYYYFFYQAESCM